jgi:hypothetical protein
LLKASVLRGQGAGEQRQIPDNAGVEDLPEGADAVGQHDAVDAVLQVGVLVAHMQFAARRRILGHARKLQQHLVQRRVVALRQRLDLLMVDLMDGRAAGRGDILASLVELVVLAGQDLLLGLRRDLRRFVALMGRDMRLRTPPHLRLTWRGDADAGQGDGVSTPRSGCRRFGRRRCCGGSRARRRSRRRGSGRRLCVDGAVIDEEQRRDTTGGRQGHSRV